MGLSSTKTKTTSQSNSTSTPNTFAPAVPAVTSYYDKVNGLMGADPASFISGPNALQQQAATSAAQLGSQTPGVAQAQQATGTLLNQLMGPTASAQTAPSYQVAQAQTPTNYNVAQAQAPAQYQVANVANVAAPTVTAAQIGQAPTAAQAAAVKMGDQMMASGGGAGEIERAKAESLLTNLNSYMNPYLDSVVKNTLGNMDQQSAVDRARYAAQAAKGGAFGGSRFGIGESNLVDAQGRSRASAEAGLRADAFNTGANLSNLDAGRRQEAGMFNAGQFNDRGNLNAQLASQASIANASNASSRDIAMAQLAGQLGMFNAGQQNQFGLAQFNAANELGMFNAGQSNDLASQIYGQQNANAQQNAGALNNANSQFYNTAANNSQFNANATNSANSQIYNATNANNQYNAGATNSANSQFYDAANNNSQFNANLGLQQANLGLNAAGQLGNLGLQQSADARSNIGTQANVGNTMYDIQQQQNLAPYLQAGTLNQLLDPSLIGQLSGQTVTGNSSGTTKEGMNLLQSLIAAGAKAGSAMAGG